MAHLEEERDSLTLGIDSWAEGLLRWYFAEGETVGAPPSNFGAMVAAISIGCADKPAPASSRLSWNTMKASTRTARRPAEIHDRALADCAKARPVRRALGRMTEAEQEVLRAVFGPHAAPLPGLGWTAPAAEWTAAARLAFMRSETAHPFCSWLVRLCVRATGKGKRAGTFEDRAVVLEIRAEAEALVRASVRGFSSNARRASARCA